MELNIAVLPGDGIGTEVIAAAMRVLEAVAHKAEHKINATFEVLNAGQAVTGDLGGRASCSQVADAIIAALKHVK